MYWLVLVFCVLWLHWNYFRLILLLIIGVYEDWYFSSYQKKQKKYRDTYIIIITKKVKSTPQWDGTIGCQI